MNTKHTGVYRLFTPALNAECLCGSGKKFKRCCADKLPGFDIGKRARAAFNQEDFLAALAASRADITQYTIWHKSNTDPLLRSAPDVALRVEKGLLEIDIRALSDYVEFMRFCYTELGTADQFPATLERLRSNIDHPKWQRRVIYLHALNALSANWDEEAGRRELRKLDSMESETDVEILQLYIDIFGEKLGFSERLELIDRVILLAAKEGERLHYRCLKAVGYLMVEDQQGAECELLSAIEAYQASRDEGSESLYEKHHYAMATELLGRLKNDTQLLDQAERICGELLASDHWTKAGRANVYRQLGDVLRCKSEWGAARDAYLSAFDNHPRQIFKVFIAECLLNLEGPKPAANVLDSITISELEPAEFLDYVFTFGVVSVEDGQKEMLKSAEELLRRQNISDPHGTTLSRWNSERHKKKKAESLAC